MEQQPSCISDWVCHTSETRRDAMPCIASETGSSVVIHYYLVNKLDFIHERNVAAVSTEHSRTSRDSHERRSLHIKRESVSCSQILADH